MSKDESDTYLKFGQGILIQGFKSDDHTGFLTAKGFADSQAKYETYDKLLYFKNYRNAIFQILPSSNFEINDELRKARETGEVEEANLKIMEARAKSEQTQFGLSIKSKDKSKVCFGSPVIFKHIDSETYLSGTIRPSSGSNGAFTVEVTENMSQAMVFQLLPYRSYEFEGMPIPFDCPIKIKNQFNNGYLTFEKLNMDSGKDEKTNLFQKKPIQGDDSYKIPVKTNSTTSKIYECVTYFVDLSQEKQVPMPWKFTLHMNDVDNDILIQHDIVYLQHTENNGVLTASKNKIVLKEMKGESTTELCFYECLWEIEKHEGDHEYILRHLMSGMTLGIDMNEETGQPKVPKLIDITDGPEVDLGVVELRTAKKAGGDINSESYVNVCWGQYCIDIKKKTADDRDYRDMDMVEESRERRVDKQKMKELAMGQLEYTERDLQFTRDISKHCFIIMEIENDLKKDLLFALSFHSKIIELREDLKFGATEAVKKVGYIRMMQVTEKIGEIKDFLKNCTGEEAKQDHIHPIKKRQMICKDLGISELLFELLYYMKKNEQEKIFEGKHNQLEKFHELYNTCYEVIIQLIRNNYLFKVHVSKWILFVIDDVIRSNEQCRLNALKEILKDNTYFVNNLVTEQLIANLTQHLTSPPDITTDFNEIKYIEIFRSLCIVGGKVDTNNQIVILEKFVKEMISNKKYTISLKKNKGEIMFEAAVDKINPKWRSFPDYHKMCKEEYETAWDYSVSYLNLMADMVQGRNKTVQNYVATSFSLDVLTELLERYELHEAEVPIIRIIHYLHIESESFYPVERQQRIMNFNHIGQQEIQMNTTKSENKPWEPPLGKIMTTMSSKLNNYKFIDPKDVKSNETLFEVLNFVWQTLNLGFFEKKEGLRLVLDHVLRILTPPETSVDYYTACRLKSKKNQLMVKCKLECMKIIQYILDYDEDLAIKRICVKFKDFEMPLKKAHIMSKIENPSYSFSLDFVKNCFEENGTPSLLQAGACAQMIQLSNYGNPELTSQSISVMRRILTSKELQIDKFNTEIFVCQKDQIALVQYIEKCQDKFFLLDDPNMINVSTKNQDMNYYPVQRQDGEQGVMQELYIISELMKSENSVKDVSKMKTLVGSKTYAELATSKLINFTNQRHSSDIMKQQVVDASNIHKKVLTYILNCKEFPTADLAEKMLHLSYKYLVCLIENYQDIKLQLIPHLGQMRHHIERNLGCIDFLKEIYDNNKSMLYNELEIVEIIKQICEIINDLPIEESFYKSKLLDFFRYLIFCNEKALDFNQIQILKIMQDDTFTNIFITTYPQDLERLVAEYEVMNKQPEDRFNPVVKRTPVLVYTETFYQIMGSLIDNNNKVNMGKLIKRFPFDVLVKSVRNSGKCWPLKRNVRAFMNRLYYYQSEITDFIKTIMSEEFDNIIKDLNDFIEIKSKSNASDYEGMYFENPVRFSYLESYLYLNLQEVLLTLYTMITNKKLEEEIKNFLHSSKKPKFDDHYNMIRICERLGWIKSYFNDKKNIYTSSLLKFLMAKFKAIIAQFDDSIYAQGMAMMGGRLRTKTEKETARKHLIEKIMLGDIGTFYITGSGEAEQLTPLVYLIPEKFTPPQDDKEPNRQKLIAILRRILKREKRDFENKDEEISYKMQKLVSAIKLEPAVYEYFLTDYRYKLQISSEGSEDMMFDYIKVIIEINSEDPTALSPELKIFILQLISGLVEQANKYKFEELTPLDKWQSDQIDDDSRPAIRNIQNKLKKCQLSLLLSDMMKENIVDNIPLANAILYCAISFLLSGYTATQNNLLEILREDTENKVMRNMDALITKLGGLIRKNISEASGGADFEEGHFSVSTIDNYDYYNKELRYCTRKNVFEPNSTNEKLYCDLCITTYRRAFKFLQLLCQSNNIQGKNFIREQPNSRVRPSNFINIATKQLRSLFQTFCKDIQEIPMFLTDFILEVTQVPVRSNQENLMNLTFFEDLCNMETYFRDGTKLSQRNLQTIQPLEEIYFKAVEIILSNFQGNQKNIFSLLDSKIDPAFLTSIMAAKLTEMQVETKQQMIAYIERTTYADDKGNIHLDDSVEKILNIIIIFLKVQEKLGKKSRIFDNYQREKSRAKSPPLYDYLQKCLLNIEITNDKDQVQRVYFPKIPVFESLSGGLKDYVMYKVDRGTHRDKIISLLGYTEDIKLSINKSYQLMKNEHISQENIKSSYKLAAIMSVVVCLYMMRFYDVIIEYGGAEFVSGTVVGLGRFLLSLMQLSMTCVYMYYWFKLKIWYKPEYKPHGQPEEGPAEEKAAQDQPQEVIADESPLPKYHPKTIIKLLLKVLRPVIKVMSQVLSSFSSQEQTFYKCPQFYRIAMFLIVSIVGTFIHPPIFFIHLLDIFCNHPMLGNIFQAIAYSIGSLFYVCLMGVVFTLIFCTVTFSNYMKNIYSADDSVDDMCDSMFSCVMKLYVSGVINQTMEEFQIVRFLYDMIYATFFGMLFGNIVSGIMLDAFGSLRGAADQLSADKSNNCYMCNISREKVEKSGLTFPSHILGKHYLWNYVYFIYSLELKDPTNFTGLEYVITNKYNRSDEENDVSWIPLGDQAEFDSAEIIDKLMKKIEDATGKAERASEDLQDKISAFNIMAEEY